MINYLKFELFIEKDRFMFNVLSFICIFKKNENFCYRLIKFYIYSDHITRKLRLQYNNEKERRNNKVKESLHIKSNIQI